MSAKIVRHKFTTLEVLPSKKPKEAKGQQTGSLSRGSDTGMVVPTSPVTLRVFIPASLDAPSGRVESLVVRRLTVLSRQTPQGT